ncbi:formamidopyrimidine-DNA glycosylase [Pedobacter suwonensis]|uniref:Formamidopyrimidine-DNA glycosylase n=1 Tax=Pedobacter suwonensis TaxID=332999 RepID=A0A1I0TR13_9SPHI|nr:DNA-formamidopyrimidine glycosylase family protein [Pedobacter suwonensis]SFA54162.1 formamidopyrimidine-DNA glycosylase [Pedobacter suwonensis]
MAELPDLEVFAQILSRRFKGKTLKELEVKVTKKLNVTAAQLKARLEGKKLSNVLRYGKTLHFHFGKEILQVHLMLRGELEAIHSGSELPKYAILAFHFSGGEGFALVDSLRAATPTLNPDVAKAPDALEMDEDYFTRVLFKSKKMVKEVLMDQKKIRGIGNSYADEILWDARVSPFSISSAIPEKILNKLFDSLKSVLKEAITAIAKENGDELRGELRDLMKIHGAKLKKSPSGAIVKSEKIGGRTSYYTDEQQLYS